MVGAALALAFLGRSAALPAPTASAASSGLRVLIRVDTDAAKRQVRLADLMRDVRAIWTPYVDIVFADTSDLGGDGYDDELQLVVSPRPGSDASGTPALGWITFLSPGRPGHFVTVSVATARSLMTRERWMGRRVDQLPPALQQQFVTRAVSWSAAHEIGHFLLRTSAHSQAGLMKAQLTAEEVMRNDRGWIHLELHEIEALRRRAAHETLVTKLRLDPPNDAP
jgi:hypothetical protein